MHACQQGSHPSSCRVSYCKIPQCDAEKEENNASRTGMSTSTGTEPQTMQCFIVCCLLSVVMWCDDNPSSISGTPSKYYGFRSLCSASMLCVQAVPSTVTPHVSDIGITTFHASQTQNKHIHLKALLHADEHTTLFLACKSMYCTLNDLHNGTYTQVV